MPIQAVKIPQNVHIEDRIVGPLTLRQVIICTIGGGISYALWASITKAVGSPSIIVTVLAWLPAVLSVAFAFVKINDISMLKFVLLMLERSQKPNIRVWTPRQGITVNIRTFQSPEDAKLTVTPRDTPQDRLQELSSILDSTSTSSDESGDAPAPPRALPVDAARISVDPPSAAAQSAPVAILLRDLSPRA